MSNRRKQARNRSNGPLLMMIAGGLLLIALAAVLLLTNQTPPQLTPVATVDETDSVERISLEDAKAAFDAGTAVFLDVRTQGQYDQSHIAGAVLIPLNDLANQLGELDPNAEIVTYCT